MKRLDLLDSAEADLDAAVLWYSADIDLAREFYQEFWNRLDLIQHFPQIFPLHGKSYRRGLMKKFPYSIIYKELAESIEIHAVFHLSRKDDHWLT